MKIAAQRLLHTVPMMFVFACSSGGGQPSDSTSSANAGQGGTSTTSANTGGASTTSQGGMTPGTGGMGPSLGPPPNRVGIGLVGPGNATQWDRTAELTGPGGHIKLILPGVDGNTTEPSQDWVDAVAGAYARDLVPVLRMGPHWGDRNLRQWGDGGDPRAYQQLAARYASVVASLPRRQDWPLVVEVHNEPNLCYEWACQPQNAPTHVDVPSGWMHYSDMAAEYARFLSAVTDAVHDIGDPRLLVINGGLAPGGAVACECGGNGFTPGITSLEFLQAMTAEVPDLFDRLDGFASHPYPAEGEGWGFFVSYAQSKVGLAFYQRELDTIGKSLPVYITETGWTVGAGAMGSREEVAQWTVQAFQNEWQAPAIVAVMPFMLQDGNWNDFAWLDSNGAPYPVFDQVKAWRCGQAAPEACP